MAEIVHMCRRESDYSDWQCSGTKECQEMRYLWTHVRLLDKERDGLCPRRFWQLLKHYEERNCRQTDRQTDRCLRILVLPVTCLAIACHVYFNKLTYFYFIAVVRGWAKAKEVERTAVTIVHRKSSRTWNIKKQFQKCSDQWRGEILDPRRASGNVPRHGLFDQLVPDAVLEILSSASNLKPFLTRRCICYYYYLLHFAWVVDRAATNE